MNHHLACNGGTLEVPLTTYLIFIHTIKQLVFQFTVEQEAGDLNTLGKKGGKVDTREAMPKPHWQAERTQFHPAFLGMWDYLPSSEASNIRNSHVLLTCGEKDTIPSLSGNGSFKLHKHHKPPKMGVTGATGCDIGLKSFSPSAIILCDSSVLLKPVGLLHLTHQSDEQLTNQGARAASSPISTMPLPRDPHQALPKTRMQSD
ncbi:hypothetical protein P7K49_034012 [Saguinus oedipus]|uniref:Uncharacterized protein n=1 Tax=Saguinus oedipus TaxID=9490 RepID=A0ABQ9TUA9_SAGOE|nr:hypothetical protein P7K49_034012 [Saguinus oedipus]